MTVDAALVPDESHREHLWRRWNRSFTHLASSQAEGSSSQPVSTCMSATGNNTQMVPHKHVSPKPPEAFVEDSAYQWTVNHLVSSRFTIVSPKRVIKVKKRHPWNTPSTSKKNKQQNQNPEGNHSKSWIVELDFLLYSWGEIYHSHLPLIWNKIFP